MNGATASVGWSGRAAGDVTDVAAPGLLPGAVGTASVELQYVKARIRAAETTTTVRGHL